MTLFFLRPKSWHWVPRCLGPLKFSFWASRFQSPKQFRVTFAHPPDIIIRYPWTEPETGFEAIFLGAEMVDHYGDASLQRIIPVGLQWSHEEFMRMKCHLHHQQSHEACTWIHEYMLQCCFIILQHFWNFVETFEAESSFFSHHGGVIKFCLKPILWLGQWLGFGHQNLLVLLKNMQKFKGLLLPIRL